MFEKDAFRQREKALEDEFFHRVDEKLRKQLREKMEREKSKERIAEATGFENQELLDHLVEAGFESTSLAALALVPPIFVAWADGEVTAKERQAVMGEALKRGVDDNPVSIHLIEGWLENRPPESLWNLWREYAVGIHESMLPAASNLLKIEIMNLATNVAKVSGGRFGRGKISRAEQKILDEIKAVAG